MKKYRIFTALLLCLCLILPVFSAAAEDEPSAKPAFITESGGLYAHAKVGSSSSQAWTKWSDHSGVNAENNVKYIFLPAYADNDRVELYNNYDETVTVSGTQIPSGGSATVSYTDGEKLNVTRGDATYSLVIRKSDAEASVFVNDPRSSYVDANGSTVNTDLYSFLILDKENSVKGSSVSVVSDSGITDTVLKKIKGRGNTNWRETDKKPFNLTFNSSVTIGHTAGKKFSFVSNAKDSTLLRNSVMYDLADEVSSPYAPNSSFVDFYVNGVYRGCYIACDKIDLGKSAVVSLPDSSDKQDTGFNFLIEVDVWNYQNDVYFVTDRGYHVVLKTPDLDGYTESNASMKTQYDYIKDTYQSFENTLYSGTLSELEQICDLDSLASMYLLQDLGKNCDGGYTSTYFTYNATEGKFYAAPIWDCDSDLGAVNCTRDGCSYSTSNVKGWTTRLATYNRTVNPYGKAFTTSGKTSDGKSFEDIVKEVWNTRFVPAVDTLLGKAQPSGRLKSIDDYASSITKARYNNYIMWDFMWLCSDYRNTGLNKSYQKNYEGELQYLKDWTSARADWITSQFSDTHTEPEGNVTVYFKNTRAWNTVDYYVWADGNTHEAEWPGKAAQYLGKTVDGFGLYKAVFDSKYVNVIFNNGDNAEQTANLVSDDNALYSPTENFTLKSNKKRFECDAMTYSDSPLLGDPDLSGSINVNDVTLIQLSLVGLKPLGENEKKVADADRNGTLNIRDATTIQLYLANRITEL